MEKEKTGRLLLLALIVLIAAGLLGYYLYTSRGRVKEEKEPEKIAEVSPKEEDVAIKEKKPQLLEEIKKPPEEEITTLESKPEEDPCTRIDREIKEFFQYLDSKSYVLHMDSNADTLSRFKDMVKGLSSQPPVPAGEGIDPRILIENIYHFYHALNLEDIHLIKQVLGNESDTIELNLYMFYRWLAGREKCSAIAALVPSKKTLFLYAGFFVNTTGGRAYLFRRSPGIRLLTTYYCLRILHDADKGGYNTYGINIAPYIASLRDEIIRYPDLQFQKEYISKLNEMALYYLDRRQISSPAKEAN